MTQLTLTHSPGAATRTLLAPVCGMAVYLLAGVMTQPYDAGDLQFGLIASGLLVVVAATVAYAATRVSGQRAVPVAALSLAVLGLASLPFLFWLGIPQIFGATAAGLALEGRASQHRWTAVTVAAGVAGLAALCLGAAVFWIW